MQIDYVFRVLVPERSVVRRVQGPDEVEYDPGLDAYERRASNLNYLPYV